MIAINPFQYFFLSSKRKLASDPLRYFCLCSIEAFFLFFFCISRSVQSFQGYEPLILKNSNSVFDEPLVPPGQLHGGLFLKDADKKVRQGLLDAPWPIRCVWTGRRSTFAASSALWGLALQKFSVKLPALWIEAYLCGLLKEIPMELSALFSKRCYKKGVCQAQDCPI
jgi:hypothetical protein